MSDDISYRPDGANDAETTGELRWRDPVVEAYKKDLDRTLLLENLRKTPDERVRALIALRDLAAEARRAGRNLRG